MHRVRKRVRGRHALITGGSAGIGFALAQRLLRCGAGVTLVARNAARLDAAKQQLEHAIAGARVRTLSVDVSDAESVAAQLTPELQAQPIDYLFNNAGVSRPGYFWAIPPAEFKRQNEINFDGVVHVTRAALPTLKTSTDAHIVNVGSLSSVIASLGHSAYCSSKFALYGFSDVLRAELKPLGIRVSIALPPEVETGMLAAELPHLPPGAKELQQSAGLLSADAVALAILRGMNSSNFEIIPGALARASVLAYRWLPNVSRAYCDWVVRRANR
ncbi:MAG: hypothetical protein RL701_4206 [Pseudomonadota bacterium]